MTSNAQSVSEMIGGDVGKRIIFIDVRPKADFARAHLSGTKNMDVRYSEVRKDDYVPDLSMLGTNKAAPVVIYGAGPNDKAAESVARQAVAEGFTNVT